VLVMRQQQQQQHLQSCRPSAGPSAARSGCSRCYYCWGSLCLRMVLLQPRRLAARALALATARARRRTCSSWGRRWCVLVERCMCAACCLSQHMVYVLLHAVLFVCCTVPSGVFLVISACRCVPAGVFLVISACSCVPAGVPAGHPVAPPPTPLPRPPLRCRPARWCSPCCGRWRSCHASLTQQQLQMQGGHCRAAWRCASRPGAAQRRH
jgi:hypothetical protein